MLEYPYREIGWRIRLVDIFEDRRSALGVATPFILRASEDWALRKYMDMTPLKALYTKFAT
jgi:putative transposase